MPGPDGLTLIVGYDGSPASRCAVAIAADRAGSRGRLIIIQAYEEGPDLTGALDWEGEQNRRQDKAQATLDALLVDAADDLAATRFEAHVAMGPPASVLTDIARELDAHEIVLGARGLGRVRALLGSVSHEVLRRADRPVLVIPSDAVPTVQRWSAGGGERPRQTPAASGGSD
jgi:nucleotide-binding universal stress UspA family protein